MIDIPGEAADTRRIELTRLAATQVQTCENNTRREAARAQADVIDRKERRACTRLSSGPPRRTGPPRMPETGGRMAVALIVNG